MIAMSATRKTPTDTPAITRLVRWTRSMSRSARAGVGGTLAPTNPSSGFSCSESKDADPVRSPQDCPDEKQRKKYVQK
jgi:hypothetical protein